MTIMRFNFVLFLFFATTGFGQPIILNDQFDDWESIGARFEDPKGDQRANNVDFTDIRISNDDRFLFVYFNTNKEINLQENNNITIYIDIDNSVNTGRKIYGIGAEITYNLGQRQGFLHTGSSTFSVSQSNIGLVTSPTVTSDVFELAIRREFSFSGNFFKMGDIVKITIVDEINNGDRAPDIDGGYSYRLQNYVYSQPLELTKASDKHLRIVSYNVLKDKFFSSNVKQYYDRIFKVINPDIIGFCEIYNNSSAQTAALIEEYLPSGIGQQWYHAAAGDDIRVVSRYPVINTASIDGNGAFLIDLGSKKLVFIMAHLPCCNNESQRQAEVDKIMSFIRGIKFGISPFTVPIGSPIVLAGDMNLVGLKQQLVSMLTGDIVNNNTYGPDFKPDWDNTDLEDANPLTTGVPMTFTWNSTGSYSPGRLDYIIYTGSVMSISNSFVLYTPGMLQNDLNKYGLNYYDVDRASDHLPVVVDFDLQGTTSTESASSPLPFRFIRQGDSWSFESELIGRLTISELSGRLVYTMDKNLPGKMDVELPPLSGLYIISFYTGRKLYSLKVFK